MKEEAPEAGGPNRKPLHSSEEEHSTGLVMETGNQTEGTWRKLRVGVWDRDMSSLAFPRTPRLMVTQVGPELTGPAVLNGVVWSQSPGSKL